MTQREQAPKIGIIGDGQLALMLADALIKLELDFLCYAPSEHSPVASSYPLHVTTDLDLFRESCDVFTLENEFRTTQELTEMLREKKDSLFPRLESYQHFADKISQRKLYDELELASPRWMVVEGSDLTNIMQNGFSFPFVAKASSGGYDGKGVRLIRNPSEFNSALDAFGFYEGKSVLLEELVTIKQELAQGFIRSEDGKCTLLPLVETVQVHGVCQYVYFPAPVTTEVEEKIHSFLRRLMNVPLIGIFNFEFFVDHQGEVFINEGAPRPHNSQHLTIDASSMSQFELLARHLRSMADIPSTVSTRPSVMINILGKSQGPGYELTLPEIRNEVSVHPKLYGKEKCFPGRKMGHVNLIATAASVDLKEIAAKVFKEYHI